MARDDRVLEQYRRPVTPELYTEVRELYKAHSIAEDRRDVAGLLATLTPDCVYALPQFDAEWHGHDGAARFYGGLLGAFPDIRFDLRNVVIGPQGVFEEADVTGTWRQEWQGRPATGAPVEFRALIFFPWDGERRLFGGERVYVDDPAALGLRPTGPTGPAG
jgi:predicted ester cyclase